jgi:hypothetical protein
VEILFPGCLPSSHDRFASRSHPGLAVLEDHLHVPVLLVALQRVEGSMVSRADGSMVSRADGPVVPWVDGPVVPWADRQVVPWADGPVVP